MLFRAAARYLLQHGANHARKYSIKDSARGSLLVGANLGVGNRLPTYHTLLVASLLLDDTLDAGGPGYGDTGSASQSTAGRSGDTGAGGANAHAPLLLPGQQRFGTGAGGGGARSGPGGGLPGTGSSGSGAGQQLINFQALLRLAEDPTVAEGRAAALPYWAHLARAGIVVDLRRGHLLWCDGEARVSHGVHGVRVLSERELGRAYGAARGPLPLAGHHARPSGAANAPASAGGVQQPSAASAIAAGTTAAGAAGGPSPNLDDAHVTAAKARLADVMASSMPVGALTGGADGGGGGAAGAGSDSGSGGGGGYGVISTGWDEAMAPLLALLTARYDAWLRSDPSRSGDVEGVLDEVDRERAEFEAGVAAERAQAESGGQLPTVDEDGEVENGGDAETDGAQARRSYSRASRADVPRPATLLGAAVPRGLFSDSSHASAPSPVASSTSRGGGDELGSSGPQSGGARSASSPSPGARGPAVDYTFLAEAVQAAFRFVYSPYCSYGFGALWRDLDGALERCPRVKSMLQGVRRIPLPLLPAQVSATAVGALPDAAAPSTPPVPESDASALARCTSRGTRRLRIFLLTNAGWDHLAPAMRHAYGADWADLFDAIFVEARKKALFAVAPPLAAAAAAQTSCASEPGGAAKPTLRAAGGGAADAVGDAGEAFSGLEDDDGPVAGGGARAIGSGGGSRAGSATPATGQATAPLRPLDAKTGRPLPAAAAGGLLRSVDGSGAGAQVADLAACKLWSGGCLSDIVATLAAHAYVAAPPPGMASARGVMPDTAAAGACARVCYVGDHARQDVIGPAVAAGWTTVAVVPGLAALAGMAGAEGVIGAPMDAGSLGFPPPASAPAATRSHLLSTPAASALEYHCRSVGSGPYWAAPALHTAPMLPHASLMVPSVDWLARALLPGLTAAGAASDKAGTARLPVAPLVGVGAGGGAPGGTGAGAMPPSPVSAAPAAALPPAARRALLRSALALALPPRDAPAVYRLPPPQDLLQACLVAAQAKGPTPAALRRLLALPANLVTPATLPPPAGTASVGAGAPAPAAASASVPEVGGGACGCMGGGRKRSKPAAPEARKTGAEAVVDDAAAVADELAAWRHAWPWPAAAASGRGGDGCVGGEEVVELPASTALADVRATGGWFTPVVSGATGDGGGHGLRLVTVTAVAMAGARGPAGAGGGAVTGASPLWALT